MAISGATYKEDVLDILEFIANELVLEHLFNRSVLNENMEIEF